VSEKTPSSKAVGHRPAVPTHGAGAAAAPRSPDVSPALLRSVDLFGAAREVLIEHHSQLYRLRHTAQGKLILTK